MEYSLFCVRGADVRLEEEHSNIVLRQSTAAEQKQKTAHRG